VFAFVRHPLAFRGHHRIVSIVLIAVFVAGVTGLPLVQRQPSVEGRYPCEECGCGCSSAEFCWDKCCCHTDVQKLEWAYKNGVAPPDFLVARVKKATIDVASNKASSPKCCCSCEKSAGSKACPIATATESKINESADPVGSVGSFRLVRMEDAARCRGVQWLWSVFSVATVEQPDPVCLHCDAPFLCCLAIVDDRADSRSDQPDPPVPWRALLAC
jgi:hypothetical protein